MAATPVKCTVKAFRQLTPTVFEVDYVSEPHIPFEAGQFTSIVIPSATAEGRDLRRAYSIASAPEKQLMTLCVKLVDGGPGTNFLYRLRPGDTFKAFSSYGHFVYKPAPGTAACFIATGTGIAPFCSMAGSQAFQENPPTHTYCLLGVRESNEILYDDFFKNLPNSSWFPYVSQPEKVSTTPPSGLVGKTEELSLPPSKNQKDHFIHGRVTEFFKNPPVNVDWSNTHFYLCGNSAMIDEVKKLLTEKGVAKEFIHQEIYYRV